MARGLTLAGALRRFDEQQVQLATAEQQFQQTQAIVQQTIATHINDSVGMLDILQAKAESLTTSAFRFEVRSNSPLNIMQNNISSLKKNLEVEIQSLSAKSSRWSFFTNFEIATKQRKLAAMTQLEKTNTINDMVQVATGMSKDSRIMRSMKTSRTKELLNAIFALSARKQADDCHQQDAHAHLGV